jgi:tetratricopeptide (TPR) repeat protein
MSPEQGRGDSLTTASDLYSLAVILFEMITGDVPFNADTPLGLIQKQINDPPPPLEFFRKDLPQEVSVVLQKALAKKPQDRYQSALEMASAFAKAIRSISSETVTLAGKTVSAGQTPIITAGKKATAFPNRWLLAGVILLTALVIGGVVLWAAKQAAANTVKRCSTPLGCQTIAQKLMESDRYVLAAEALEKAVSLVPVNQQPQYAQLKCDQGDVFTELGNRLDARAAYRDCIGWTRNERQLQSIRDYAQQKIKELK